MSGPKRRPGSHRDDHGTPGSPPGERVEGASSRRPRGMEWLADLLPQTVRQFGLEDQFDQARAAAAWLRLVEERVPAAVGACRLADLTDGIATIETDEPIVAQEIRLRAPELLTALRGAIGTPIRQIRVMTRHV
jgi:predicted nucleic acid-binding Zn ribbon protein